jgi:hypothetical protein
MMRESALQEGFERSVHEIVAPALAEFGFAVVQSGARNVRFESDRVWAWVFHEEGPSHAIGFRFDRLGDPNKDGAYLVPHAMQLVDPAAAAREEDPSARTADEVRQWVGAFEAQHPDVLLVGVAW